MEPGEMIAILTAYRSGRLIEMKQKNDSDDLWHVVEIPIWNFELFDYRISDIEDGYYWTIEPGCHKYPKVFLYRDGIWFDGDHDEIRMDIEEFFETYDVKLSERIVAPKF